MENKVCIISYLTHQPSEDWIRNIQLEKPTNVKIFTNNELVLPATWEVYTTQSLKEQFEDKINIDKFTGISKLNILAYLSYIEGSHVTIYLGEDCFVKEGFIKKHIESLKGVAYTWENPLETWNMFQRGLPYFDRNVGVVANMGLVDLDNDVNSFDNKEPKSVPKLLKRNKIAHNFLPISIQNFAIWSYAIPGFCLLPDYEDLSDNFKYHNDVWGGYIFQKFTKELNFIITYGNPMVNKQLSKKNKIKEQESMIRWEQDYYLLIDEIFKEIELNGNYEEMLNLFCQKIDTLEPTFLKFIIEPFKLYNKLFDL